VGGEVIARGARDGEISCEDENDDSDEDEIWLNAHVDGQPAPAALLDLHSFEEKTTKGLGGLSPDPARRYIRFVDHVDLHL
jgi:hypothetical protein